MFSYAPEHDVSSISGSACQGYHVKTCLEFSFNKCFKFQHDLRRRMPTSTPFFFIYSQDKSKICLGAKFISFSHHHAKTGLHYSKLNVLSHLRRKSSCAHSYGMNLLSSENINNSDIMFKWLRATVAHQKDLSINVCE